MAENTVDTLEVKVASEAQQALTGLQNLSKELRKLKKEMQGGWGTKGKSFFNFSNDLKEIERLKKAAASVEKITPKLNTKDIDTKIFELQKKFKDVGTDFQFKGNTSELEKTFSSLESKLDRLYAKEDKIRDLGSNFNTSGFESLQYDIAKTSNQLDVLREKMAELNSESASKLEQAIKRATTQNIEPSQTVSPQPQTAKIGSDYFEGRNVEKEIQNLNDITVEPKVETENIDSAIENLRAKFKDVGTDFQFKGNTAELEKAITKAENELDRLYEKEDKIRETGGNFNSTGFSNLQYDISKTSNQLDAMRKKMSETSKTRIDTGSWSKLQKVASATGQTFRSLSSYAGQIKNVFSSLASGVQKAYSALTGFNKESKNTGMSLGRMLAQSILFSSVFSAISSITTGLKTGAQNLAQYSNEYNQSLSMMLAALMRLQNAWGVAFAPIVNVVAPLITKFLNLMSAALNAVGRFFATLTGKTFTPQAISFSYDYAKSLEKVGNSASKASKGANKLKKSLSVLPFDELNQLTKNTSSTSNSGNGAYSVDPKDMFKTVDADNGDAVNKWAERIRKAFLDHDWEGLGKEIANMLNAGLQKVYDAISWDNVGPKITAFTTAFTKTFNSLVDNLDWDLLGRTVGEGINDLVNTFNLLTDPKSGIDFENIGKKLSTGLRGALDQIQWTNLGNALGNGFMISWRTLDGFVTDMSSKNNAGLTGWAQLGNSLGNTINGVFDKVDFKTIGNTLVNGINGAFETLKNFTTTVNWSGIAQNITNGLNTMIHGIDWAKNGQIFSQFITDLLGTIQSVAEKTDWQGLGKGIGDFLSNVDWGTIFKDVFSIIANVLGGLISGLSQTTAGKLGIGLTTAIGGIKLASAFTNLFMGQSLLQTIIGAISGGGGIVSTAETALETGMLGTFSASGGVMSALVSGASSLVSTLGTILGGIGSVIFSPTGLLIAGIVAGVALIVTHWDDIKSAASDVYKKVSGAWDDLQKNTSKTWQDIKSSLSDTWAQLKKDAKSGFENIKGNISNAWNNAKKETTSTWKDIASELSSKWEGIKGDASTKWTQIHSDLSTAWENVKSTASSKFGKIKNDISTAWVNVNTTASSSWKTIKDTLSTAWDGVKTNASTYFKNVKSTISGAWKESKKDTANAATEISKSASSMASSVKKAIDGDFKDAKDQMGKSLAKMKDTASDKFGDIKDSISGSLKGIKKLMNFKWSLPHIKLPHFSLVGSFDLKNWSVPHISVNWYKKGGIFTDASLVGVGEAGNEAVLPLTNRKTMSMIAESISNNMPSGSGIDKQTIVEAVAQGIAMSMINNQANGNINLTVYSELRTENNEVLARAVTKGQKSLNSRFEPSPAY